MVQILKIFIDTANISEIKAANELGVISGVTTNPSIIAREKRSFKEVITEIAGIVDGPVFAEVVSLDADGMVKEARELVKIHKNIVIKIPMCAEGLKATHRLKAENIPVNMTLVFSAGQALLAARAGARYVSSFLGRVDDIGGTGTDLIADVVGIFHNYGIQTEIIAASVRHPVHVIECAKIGVDIATVPYKVILQMIDHPLTKNGLERFLKDWETVPKA